MWKLSKVIYKVSLITAKRLLWEIRQKAMWKQIPLSVVSAMLFIVVGLSLPYFKPYTGTYFGHQNKILSDKEINLYNEVKEYRNRKKELDMLEGLKSGNKSSVKAYIQKKFGKDADIAVAIATAESGLTCNRYHDWMNKDKSADSGVFQVNSVHLWRVNGDKNKLLDCKTNIDIAYQIYKEQGFKPWVAYWNGSYKKHLSSL